MPRVPELLKHSAKKLIIDGYAVGEHCANLTECETKKFSSGSGVLQSLSPTVNSFSQHVMRAVLPMFLMKSTLIPLIPKIP